MGEMIDVDRAYIFAISDDGSTASNTYEWVREGIPPAIDDLQEVPVDVMPWFMKELRERGEIVISDVSQLGEEAAAEREMFRMQQIESLIVVATVLDGSLLGFVGFDAVGRAREWEEADLSAARVIGGLLVAGLVRDRLEMELRDVVGRFHAVADLSGSIVFEWSVRDEEGMQKLGNIESVLGYQYSTGQKTYQWWFEKIHPDDREAVERATERVLASDGSDDLDVSYRFRRADGSWAWLRTMARVIRDGKGEAIAMIGVDRDLTDSKHIEEEMRIREERSRTLIEASADTVMVIDEDLTVVYASPQAEEMFGRPLNHIVDRSIERLVTTDTAAVFREELSRIAEWVGGQTTISGMVVKPDGVHRKVEVGAANRLGDGVLDGVLLDVRDVTEKARLERRLLRASKASALAHASRTMAHEFNNVLMSIKSFSDVIRLKTDDESVIAAVDEISKAVERGRIVATQISDKVTPEESDVERVDLHLLIGDMERDLRAVLPPDIELELALPDGEIWINADPVQLGQVLHHLARNAIDAMPGGGLFRIEVTDGYEPGEVAINVSDTGGGIDAEELERIFDPLYSMGDGDGLGLSWAQQVVQAHGAEMIASSSKGRGTRIRIVYHTAEQRSGEDSDASAPRGSVDRENRARTVLLVEDEAPVAAGISTLLEMEGYQVEVMSRVRGVVEQVANRTPSAVIMDVKLPDGDGIELYRELAEAHPGLPVVFSSGHETRDHFDDLLERPEVVHLRKPYEIATLLEALERVSEASRRDE